MAMYHASFRGRKKSETMKPLRKISCVLDSDSIYNVEAHLREVYEFIISLCVTNCNAVGLNIAELKS